VIESKYQFTVNKGPQPGKIFVLMTDTITLGRDPMADISLNDPEVSRQHARLTKTASGYVVEDLGSTNGTFINGDQLESGVAVTLTDGDSVSIGSGISMAYVATHHEPNSEQTQDEFDDMFSDFSPELPSQVGDEYVDPIIEQSPELPEFGEVEPAAPSVPQNPPLVPSADDNKARKRRRNTTIAVTAVILLCCCCLLFFLSAYYFWGDLLMESLGLY
jgi:hypothetical protein